MARCSQMAYRSADVALAYNRASVRQVTRRPGVCFVVILWVNGAFLGDDRLHDGIGTVLFVHFVKTCGGLPETTHGLLKAQWQTFHGEAANLSDKAQHLKAPK